MVNYRYKRMSYLNTLPYTSLQAEHIKSVIVFKYEQKLSVFYFWIFYFLFFPRNEKKLKYLLDGDVPVQNSFNTAGFTITSRIPHCFHATTPPLSLFSQLCFKILKVFSHHFPPPLYPSHSQNHYIFFQNNTAMPSQ